LSVNLKINVGYISDCISAIASLLIIIIERITALGLKKGNWCLKKKNFFYFNFRVHVI